MRIQFQHQVVPAVTDIGIGWSLKAPAGNKERVIELSLSQGVEWRAQ